MTDEMSFREKCDFWRAWLHREDNTKLLRGWTDEKFVEECERYKDVLLLDNKTYPDYFTTHYDHLCFAPYILVVRLEVCAERAG